MSKKRALTIVFLCLLLGALLIAWLLGVFEEPLEESLGEVLFFTYTPYFFPEFENETKEHTSTVWEKVKDFDEAKFVISGKNSSVIVYMHAYTVGIFNPKTAEWIVIVSSIPEITTEIRMAIFRLDYQTSNMKKAYEFSYPVGGELTLEESIAIMEDEIGRPADSERIMFLGGNYIYSYSPIDFGGTIIVNKYSGKTIFYATIVWAGTGRLIIPEE